MNFQRGKQREEPEINLIPMIDVLLVILIFTASNISVFARVRAVSAVGTVAMVRCAASGSWSR